MSTPAPEYRTRGPAVARFFERYLRHTKGPYAGQPFLLEPWQRDFVDEFYRVDDAGRRVYRLGILGIPRGNGKTPLAAGFGLLELLTRKDSPDVFAAAASRQQAEVLFDFAHTFVDRGELKKWIKPQRYSLVCSRTSGVMRVLTSEGSLQHGLSVSAAFVDELHAFMHQRQEELYTALFTALHKRIDSFLLTITTAGYDKETILGRIYDQALAMPDGEDRGCLRIRRDIENGILFYWYGVPEDREQDWQDEALWREANPASWVSVKELRQQLNAPGFDELDFRRLHLNMWTKVRESWLPSGCWDDLRVGSPPTTPNPSTIKEDDVPADATIPDGAEIYVAVDAAYSFDTTAVSWAWQAPDGRIHLRTYVWSVRDGVACHRRVPGATLNNEELVEPFVHKLGERYRIKEIVFDPRYFSTEGRHLSERFPTAPLHQQSAPMVDAVQDFYKHARAGVLAHNGHHVLTAHVEACAGRKTDAGWRVSKVNNSKPIDAAVAAIMAASRAERAEAIPVPGIVWLGPSMKCNKCKEIVFPEADPDLCPACGERGFLVPPPV